MRVQNTTTTEYHNDIFNHNRRCEAIKLVTRNLRRFSRDVGIVGIGLSGTIATLVAHKTQRSLVIVRKPRIASHSLYTAEGDLTDEWVFVDDMIDSGKTIQHVLKQLKGGKCVGIILYNDCRPSQEFQDIPIYV